jgi:hypothetical protein
VVSLITRLGSTPPRLAHNVQISVAVAVVLHATQSTAQVAGMELAELQQNYAWEALLADAFYGKVARALEPDCSNHPFALENVTEVLGEASLDEDGFTGDAVFRLDDGRIAYVSGSFDYGGSEAVFALKLSTLLEHLRPEVRKAFGW